MRQVTEKMELDCINILKGIACSEFTIDELRQRLSNSQKFSVEHVFNKIDVRGLKKIDPSDLATFLSYLPSYVECIESPQVKENASTSLV